jgi:hypothetical protein
MKPFLFLIFFLPLTLVPVTSQARIKTTTTTCDSGITGVECRRIVSVSDYQDDNNREWPKARISFQFRSINGKSCKAQGKLSHTKNMRIIYNTSYLHKSGEWIEPGLVIEQIRKGIWPHSINWRISCKTLSFES